MIAAIVIACWLLVSVVAGWGWHRLAAWLNADVAREPFL